MGVYLNPGSSGFKRIVKNGNYIDKTGLAGIINKAIDTADNLICVSRPRRFGKSYAAQMLCAYYDKTCNSAELFEGYDISEDSTYRDHLNKYDIIYLDMTNIMNKSGPEGLMGFIERSVSEELMKAYPDVDRGNSFDELMINTAEYTGNKFIMIIDEWDAPVREIPQTEREYLNFLRMLFKSSGTTSRIFAAAYITGILAIKKDGSQSAISDFREYSMLEPGPFAKYTGFTEDEVRGLCEKHGMSFNDVKMWYDGYTAGDQHSVYNPYSVMSAVISGRFGSYWKKTSAAESLMAYIDMDEEGLQNDIARLITGEAIEADTYYFQNDFTHFASKDDVFTLMIHLGYLSYEEIGDSLRGGNDLETVAVRIPNEEIRIEFRKVLRRAKHDTLIELVKRSDKLLKDTLSGNCEAVAKAISDIRDSSYAPAFYNNEQALRYAVKMAYISSVDQYAKVEEMPTGHGIADLVFVPKRRSALPAMIIELKWNKSAEGAIKQAYERNYPEALKGYGGVTVLVGINYNADTKEHSCRIDRTG